MFKYWRNANEGTKKFVRWLCTSLFFGLMFGIFRGDVTGGLFAGVLVLIMLAVFNVDMAKRRP